MNKFLFKSNDSDLQKIIFNKLDMLLAEQRHQRSDLAMLLRRVNELINHANLQKQVDDYYSDEDKKDMPEDAETTAEQVQ